VFRLEPSVPLGVIVHFVHPEVPTAVHVTFQRSLVEKFSGWNQNRYHSPVGPRSGVQPGRAGLGHHQPDCAELGRAIRSAERVGGSEDAEGWCAGGLLTRIWRSRELVNLEINLVIC
jgi:hypothetical protein